MQSVINGITVTKGQAEVYDILATYGPLPDIALVPLTQHLSRSHQSSSSIRSRRAELRRKGLVGFTGNCITTPSGREAQVFKVVSR